MRRRDSQHLPDRPRRMTASALAHYPQTINKEVTVRG